MRAELANLNHCAVLFLSRAAANFCWYHKLENCNRFPITVKIIRHQRMKFKFIRCNQKKPPIFDYDTHL